VSAVQQLLFKNIHTQCSFFPLTAFSALTLLVGWQEGVRPVKTSDEVLMYCLSGARCRRAYGPADATATLSSLAAVKSRMVYLSGAGLPRLS